MSPAQNLSLQQEIDKLLCQLTVKRYDKQRHQRRLLILGYLIKHPEGVNPSQMAADLNMARSQLTRLLDGFEEAGYIVRCIARNDKRRFEVMLTETGIADYNNIKEEDELRCDHLAEFLGENDSMALLNLLQKINQYIDQNLPYDRVEAPVGECKHLDDPQPRAKETQEER